MSSVLSLGLISKLSFCTSCVMLWREATDDDEDDEIDDCCDYRVSSRRGFGGRCRSGLLRGGKIQKHKGGRELRTSCVMVWLEATSDFEIFKIFVSCNDCCGNFSGVLVISSSYRTEL